MFALLFSMTVFTALGQEIEIKTIEKVIHILADGIKGKEEKSLKD